MKEYKLPNGWLLAVPAYFSVLTNQDGEVVAFISNKNYGDIQPLIFETKIDRIVIKSTPHYIADISISTTKQIVVDVVPFVKETEEAATQAPFEE